MARSRNGWCPMGPWSHRLVRASERTYAHGHHARSHPPAQQRSLRPGHDPPLQRRDGPRGLDRDLPGDHRQRQGLQPPGRRPQDGERAPPQRDDPPLQEPRQDPVRDHRGPEPLASHHPPGLNSHEGEHHDGHERSHQAHRHGRLHGAPPGQPGAPGAHPGPPRQPRRRARRWHPPGPRRRRERDAQDPPGTGRPPLQRRRARAGRLPPMPGLLRHQHRARRALLEGPLMATTTIVQAPTRRTRPGLVPSLLNPAWTAGQTADVEGWSAEIRGDGIDLQVSRLDGEQAWTIDAAFRGSFPLFANGYGARYLRTRTLVPDVAEELDTAIAESAYDGWGASWTDGS